MCHGAGYLLYPDGHLFEGQFSNNMKVKGYEKYASNCLHIVFIADGDTY